MYHDICSLSVVVQNLEVLGPYHTIPRNPKITLRTSLAVRCRTANPCERALFCRSPVLPLLLSATTGPQEATTITYGLDTKIRHTVYTVLQESCVACFHDVFVSQRKFQRRGARNRQNAIAFVSTVNRLLSAGNTPGPIQKWIRMCSFVCILEMWNI